MTFLSAVHVMMWQSEGWAAAEFFGVDWLCCSSASNLHVSPAA